MPKNRYGWHQVNAGSMGEDMPLWGARIDGDMVYIGVVGQPDGGWFAVEKTLPIRTMGLSGAIGRQVISPFFYNPNFRAIGLNAMLDRGRIIGGQDSIQALNPYGAATQWAINWMIKHSGGAI